MVLCLETATSICSVALCDGNEVVAVRDNHDLKSHATRLTVLAGEVLAEAGLAVRDLEAVAVSRGPGSYTGLRIGVSAAKGMAFGASIPLISVDTTLSMFYGMAANMEGEDLSATIFCPMLDARRMEVYYALYNSGGEKTRDVRAEVITGDSFSDIPASQRIVFFGDGAAKCSGLIERENVVFNTGFRISASFMQEPAYDAFRNKRFEDVAYFEPYYLKDFIVTKPRKNLLTR
jgi:tRNA threonylcarbamoyladenosine biosynthesis protein TsaB